MNVININFHTVKKKKRKIKVVYVNNNLWA